VLQNDLRIRARKIDLIRRQFATLIHETITPIPAIVHNRFGAPTSRAGVASILRCGVGRNADLHCLGSRAFLNVDRGE
jgi:hypothetical protein